ncbi:23S rRNA (pseudouridine(1915)-N(3))-methyltransferase RlmH [Plebeiibacterium marinum]|uniref:Ribosomal RNA large subunit methyltransferase H n=1 Tax=Plebeiibacterium marinum TaxID=2992111 RepID=A0AAE3MGJ7_9BACT|nr:23S rRNA (pseudouridine(1915)-N(3))-methyltransferase RlmH [Plebeiobacterium marinum]MCW3807091.1 23S rRNA (pseudouridine(1915)-N(3))-methyltransferase RlmH [Plebeiobacterium marinum]
MKVILILIGKTDEKYLETGIAKYFDRLKHYIPFEINIIPDIKNTKNMSEIQQKEKEGDLILQHIQPGDELVLLDEGGKMMSSRGFAGFMEQKLLRGLKRLVFVVGGPYGFSDKVYEKSNGKISLSKMTFSHQMVRLIFTEQLYRAMTILKNQPYHHD